MDSSATQAVAQALTGHDDGERPICPRPWGWFQSIDINGRHHVKRIVVDPGKRLSLQKHFHRSEHWIVVRGTALVTVDAEQGLFYENQSVHIPLGAKHRLENPGKITLEIIEVQIGSYLGEDDIIRLEDDFDRIPDVSQSSA